MKLREVIFHCSPKSLTTKLKLIIAGVVVTSDKNKFGLAAKYIFIRHT